MNWRSMNSRQSVRYVYFVRKMELTVSLFTNMRWSSIYLLTDIELHFEDWLGPKCSAVCVVCFC